MRVLIGPDDRKIAAKKQPSSSSSSSNSKSSSSSSEISSEPSRKKLKSGVVHHGGSSKVANNNSNSNNSNLGVGSNNKGTAVVMGGGGRLVDRPPSKATASSQLKSGDAAMTELLREQRQRGGGGGGGGGHRDGIGSRGIAMGDVEMETNVGGNIEEGLLLSGGRGANWTHGPRGAAVAAAAASPHRSTLNSEHRNNNRTTHRNRKNPEDEDNEWQGNDSKQSSSCIYVGKSNDSNRNRHRSGRYENPATMSKTNYDDEDDDYGNHDDSTSISQFIHLLRTKHKPPLDMVEMEGDGNCLFRAISLQVYGDSSMHLEVRRRCLDFMEREADHFRDFVADEDFGEYIARKRIEGVHGNHAEIQAISELYNRSIEVFVPDTNSQHGMVDPINIFHSEYKSDDAPIRLCYMDGNHYNAIIDPLLPTAGLGLGLPGLQPGLADKLQLDQAKKISDDSAMEEKMRLAVEESKLASKAREEIEMKEALRKSSRESKATAKATAIDSDDDVYKKKAMYLSEIEAADFDLEQAVLASSLESYQKIEQERKQPSSRLGEGRRSRLNTSPRSRRSSSNSPVNRSTSSALAAGPASNQYAAAASSAVASVPSASTQAAASASRTTYDTSSMTAPTDEYPSSVQELTMNGFELSKVLHAYDLIGDNFDDLLSFLLSTATS